MESKQVEVSNTRKRLSGRAYLSMFNYDKATGHNEESYDASASRPTKEKLEGNIGSLNGCGIEANGLEVLDPSDGVEIATKICENAERPQLKCFVKEKLQSPELLNSSMKGRTPNDDTGVERDHGAMSLKRTRTDLNMDSDASDVVANKVTCITRDDVTSSPSRCKNEICVKRCGSCLKMQRYWIAQMLFCFIAFNALGSSLYAS
ncbi:hypothetical protein Dsin_001485 [Dipteronia sinensis]|uniref:Uncharacterized protein n=1 Tax=Dipteronia sinensis TaxID=43782 RepID=A0AAE0B5G4_9ROSI|nr:hypothetical protein Dsin_001485 [Dipteronia sinensis]